LKGRCHSYGDEIPRRYFFKIAAQVGEAPPREVKPLRAVPTKSTVAVVRTNDHVRGIREAVRMAGGIDPLVKGVKSHVLIKPNCNSHDPFPAGSHPDDVRTVVEMLIEGGCPREKIVVGDMSGPNWLPTRKTMRLNGILRVVEELGVKASFFDEEEWVEVKPPRATTWPDGFEIARTVYDASRIFSLSCLKTHGFGGVFTMSLKNSVGAVHPANRLYFHRSPDMRKLIAEINLAYTPDLVLVDGFKCFTSGGPAVGELADPGVILAGADRVAVDAVGASILKYYKAEGLTGISVKKQEQLVRAAEVGIGNLDATKIELHASNPARDSEFNDLVQFIQAELRA
jgi:uncharacterized protein (DUF362 family)